MWHGYNYSAAGSSMHLFSDFWRTETSNYTLHGYMVLLNEAVEFRCQHC